MKKYWVLFYKSYSADPTDNMEFKVLIVTENHSRIGHETKAKQLAEKYFTDNYGFQVRIVGGNSYWWRTRNYISELEFITHVTQSGQHLPCGSVTMYEIFPLM